MNEKTPIFKLENVSVNFGDFPALNEIDFQITQGERVALVGPSGAGKSTLISILNGSLSPSSGEMYFNGLDLNDLSARRLRELQTQIGTIYQQFNLVDSLRVIHNVNAGNLGRWHFARSLVSLVKPLEVEAAAGALDKVGIPEKIYARTDLLSGGQQQRVAIARVLVQDPQAILADEPISSLDPERSREIMDLLLHLSQGSGKTLIASLHAVKFALSHFERVIGLHMGRLLFDLPAREVTPNLTDALYRIPA